MSLAEKGTSGKMWPDQGLIDAVADSTSRFAIFELLLIGIFGVLVLVLLNFTRLAAKRESGVISLIETGGEVDRQLIEVIRENARAISATTDKLASLSVETGRMHTNLLDELRSIASKQEGLSSQVTGLQSATTTEHGEMRATTIQLEVMMKKNLETSFQLLSILESIYNGKTSTGV